MKPAMNIVAMRAFFSVYCAVASLVPVAAQEGPELSLEQPGGGFAIDGQYADVEVIRERYPNRQVKIEREVTLDTDGNYVNHGTWKMWNPSGDLIATGQYTLGKRCGLWSRWISPKDAPILRSAPFHMFQAPFVSQATFVEDVMDGNWTIFDGRKRKCCEITLRNGTRHGSSIQWLPNGSVYREETFADGLTVGDVLQLDARGELKTIASFIDGRQLTTRATNFDHSRVKQSEASFLAPKKVVAAADDFLNDRFAEFSDVGEPLRHGPWTTWYSNGQVKLEGHYERDREMGTFTWWYPNGQKAVTGEYQGGQRHGEWTWWHQNGQKASCGAFCMGRESGQWRQWNPDGTLESQVVHDDTLPQEQLAEAPSEEPAPTEVAEKPEFAPLPLLR